MIIITGQTGCNEAHVQPRFSATGAPFDGARRQRTVHQHHSTTAATATAAAATADGNDDGNGGGGHASYVDPSEVGHEPRPRTALRRPQTRPSAATG